jgi:hypothetical protein
MKWQGIFDAMAVALNRQLIQPNCLDAVVPRLKLRQPGSAYRDCEPGLAS